jgi:hypothetical protein
MNEWKVNHVIVEQRKEDEERAAQRRGVFVAVNIGTHGYWTTAVVEDLSKTQPGVLFSSWMNNGVSGKILPKKSTSSKNHRRSNSFADNRSW